MSDNPDKIDYSSEVLGNLNDKCLGKLNVTLDCSGKIDQSGKMPSLFQVRCLNDIALLMPRLLSFLNLGLDDSHKMRSGKKIA